MESRKRKKNLFCEFSFSSDTPVLFHYRSLATGAEDEEKKTLLANEPINHHREPSQSFEKDAFSQRAASSSSSN